MKFTLILLCTLLPILYSKRLFSSNINIKIKNFEKPICINCKHYIIETYNDFSSSNNKCCIFGNKDIYGGKISYDYVSECRKDEEKCGIEGKYYEPEYNLICKKMKHNIMRNYLYYYSFIAVLLQIFVILIKNK